MRRGRAAARRRVLARGDGGRRGRVLRRTRPSALTVAGVTGTNGKTTTTFLLRSILEADGRPTGLVGTVDWIVGGDVRPAPHTTPEAIDLQRLFREMLDAGDEAVVVEASSHGSHYRRLDRVRFDALVFTNLTQEHLDLHGDMEEYFQAKRRLFTGDRAAAGRGQRRRSVRPPAGGRARRARTARRSSRSGCGRRRRSARTSSSSTRAARRFTAAGIVIETRLLGIFNVENVLGAVAAALLLDIDEDAIVEGVRAVTGVPGRFEAIDEGQEFAVVVDYAHKPDALAAVLEAARDAR